jgi:hypothetical protein
VAARPAGALRRMDCLDCHNRPAHPFAVSAERAVDAALADGRVPRALPFARRDVVAALSKDYPSQDAAIAGIDRDLRAAWTSVDATRAADVTAAVTAAQTVYRQNVFPSMKVAWGTYPNNLGHTETPGCLRCHDGSHNTKSGVAVRSDCELCHRMQ